MQSTNKVLLTIFIFYYVLTALSCVNTKQVGYLKRVVDSAYEVRQHADPAIDKSDVLGITITSLNPEASFIFNTINGGPNSNTLTHITSTQQSGYLVDEQGQIHLPVLGSVQAEGLTKTALKEQLTSLITEKKLLVDPLVSIRHLNYEVTVIGEVARPTVINVPNGKISILKALGMAGDITVYGKKDNVMVLREQSGQTILKHIDLNSSRLLNSDYYYLMPNDIVYVEPNKNKLASVSRGRQLLPALLSGLSVIIIVLDRVF